jgi:hypothetical protein
MIQYISVSGCKACGTTYENYIRECTELTDIQNVLTQIYINFGEHLPRDRNCVGFRALVNISRVSGTSSWADSHVTWFEYTIALEVDSAIIKILMICISES